jgi:SPP1 family predicted phage head-tail adaptor
MKQRIEIEDYTTTSDGMGGTTATWNTTATVWGNIMPVNGSEKWEVESLKGNISHVITIRFKEGLDNESRLKYDGRTFLVKYAIDKGEESYYMKLAVTEET